jgi:hypothetical protein
MSPDFDSFALLLRTPDDPNKSVWRSVMYEHITDGAMVVKLPFNWFWCTKP